ncbi:galanin receptor type 1-like [Stylophora pistillata]|uniref:galanin receptor type 1-like n=1 Tax=Stylophora pistillata TaxID=50429 RepID=UPI000C03BA63|nr:galanin receptor type 1-like [Stylophora pistillata]
MLINNTSLDGRNNDAIASESVEFHAVKIALYVAIFILSCIGNSLVAIVILGATGMRTTPNLLVLNLAFCDLFTPALSIPFDLALEELNQAWPFGRVMCKILWPFQTALSTSSSLTLAVISLDRFRALARPLSERPSSMRIVKTVVAIHVFSTILCIPYFITLQYKSSPKSCTETWPPGYSQVYTIVLFLFQFALPLTTMSVSYLLIYRSLRSNVTMLFSESTRSYRHQHHTISNNSTSSKEESELKRREQNIHLAKIFVIVVVVFAIGMSPNQFFWLWVDFGRGAENRLFHYISVMCRLFTYANSVLNPFIYALKSKEFRSGFARIGRAGMKPLRKISTETRKFVLKKVSRSASGLIPDTADVHTLTSIQNVVVSKDVTTYSRGAKNYNSVEASDEVLLLETLSKPGAHHFFEELRESSC